MLGAYPQSLHSQGLHGASERRKSEPPPPKQRKYAKKITQNKPKELFQKTLKARKWKYK